jgi:septum formation protein
MMRLVLASKSPRRKIILQERGYEFIIDASDFDENSIKEPVIFKKVIKIACGKAKKVARRHKGSLILAVDTMVYYRRKALGQVETEKEAIKVLKMLSGKTHKVYSGICILDTKNGRMLTAYEVTTVKLKKITDKEIRSYVEAGKYRGKAGAYNISDPMFETFVEKVKGSYFNILGLPIERVEQMLIEMA